MEGGFFRQRGLGRRPLGLSALKPLAAGADPWGKTSQPFCRAGFRLPPVLSTAL